MVVVVVVVVVAARLLILEDNVEGVDDTREPTKAGQQNVDGQVHVATSLKEDSERRQDESYKQVLVDIMN